MRHDNGYGKQEVRREVFDAAICSGGADEAECLCVSLCLLLNIDPRAYRNAG